MKTIVLITTFATLLFSSSGFAQKNKETGTYPDDEIPFYEKEGIKYSKKSNTPLVFAGINDPVEGSTPHEMAFDWLTKNKVTLKIETISDLVKYYERSGSAGTNIRLRQHYNGVPVYKSEVVIHISPENTVTYVTNNYDATINTINTSSTISESKALKLAKEAIDAEGEMNYTSNTLMVYNRQENTKLIYAVILEPQSPLGSWEILVDAHSGEIVRFADRSCNHSDNQEESMLLPPPVNGTGNVFIPDPLSVALASYGNPYSDNNDATNASLDATMTSVVLQDINFTGSQYELIGPYAEIQDFENPWNGLFTQPTSDFSYNRNDDEFEAVNCYYHIDNSMRYINVTLGIPCMPFQYPTGVRFDPSGLNGADNSHYLGGSGKISFGEGGVDDAEDADVILHELGHGIHDWLTNGNLSQVDGLSEGSGDYWATSYSRSLNQWTQADPEYNWMFSWDGHNPFWNGRITNYTAIYPGGLTGSIHTDGQIWASALMRIYDILGREKVDRAFLEGLAMTGSSTSQQDAAIAVRQAAIDMNYSCADVDVFTQEFTATGYVLPALAAPTGTENSTICFGESIIVNGTVYDANNPTGTEVISGGTPACDSTVTINLTVLPQLSGSINTTLCNGDSIVVNGTTYNQNNPSGTEVFTNVGANGCDSTVTINLSFSNALSSTINTTICDGDSIIVNGTVYNAANPTGTETFTNVGQSGCDSTVTINLTPVGPLTGSVTETLCYGENMIINGTTYDANNPSGTEIFTGASGCDSTVTINLSFEPAIDASITNNEPTLSANQSGATYQWVDCNNGNAPIAGATNQEYTATANGNYAVQITMNNCTETSICETVANIGLQELNTETVLVYPNPSQGIFNVNVTNTATLEYVITDVQGRVIRNEDKVNNELTIDLSNESKGVYLMTVTQNGNVAVFKLLVE